jgi:hypothetical protein
MNYTRYIRTRCRHHIIDPPCTILSRFVSSVQAASARGVNLDGVGNHPNAWFAGSVSYHNAKNAGKDATGSATKLEASSPGAVKSEEMKDAAAP